MITADTITDEQIKALWSSDPPSGISGRELMDALGLEYGPRKPTADETRAARALCAEIINARDITDAQIRELRVSEQIDQALYIEAIWGVELKRAARARCAEIFNARAKAGVP